MAQNNECALFNYKILNKSTKDFPKFKRKEIKTTVIFRLNPERLTCFSEVDSEMEQVIEKFVTDSLTFAKGYDLISVYISSPSHPGELYMSPTMIKNFKVKHLLAKDDNGMIDVDQLLCFYMVYTASPENESVSSSTEKMGSNGGEKRS